MPSLKFLPKHPVHDLYVAKTVTLPSSSMLFTRLLLTNCTTPLYTLLGRHHLMATISYPLSASFFFSHSFLLLLPFPIPVRERPVRVSELSETVRVSSEQILVHSGPLNTPSP